MLLALKADISPTLSEAVLGGQILGPALLLHLGLGVRILGFRV